MLEELDGVLHRFGRLMASRQAQYSRDTGLPAPQYMVLRILLQEGDMRVSDIASTLGVKNPAASGLIQCLEDDGMVARRNDDTDHRVVLVSITERGRQRFGAADEYRRMILRLLTKGLPAEDIETLVRVMSHMADVVSGEADRPATTA
ncbi:MAG: MarR family transcriptional regulator [Coriobacteriia bacterium]|nr:MarR family transcriptional regulator [Coriobacteriia bacterium]